MKINRPGSDWRFFKLISGEVPTYINIIKQSQWFHRNAPYRRSPYGYGHRATGDIDILLAPRKRSRNVMVWVVRSPI
ncbi:MAG: hypothetical protein WBM32_04405 [Crocosphaera sp.]